ncbi:hypothetical protein [Microbulbifer agarilyticus]
MNSPTSPWKILIPRHANPNASRNIYVHKEHHADWEAIKKSHQANYYLGAIMRATHSLNARGGGRSSMPSVLKQTGFAIHYLLDENGDVRLLNLDVDEKYGLSNGQQTTGLYQVRFTGDDDQARWRTESTSNTQMQLKHRWKEAHYSAVAGKFDSKEQAGEKLIEHIRHAYQGDLRGRNIDMPNNHYSLYWQNGGYRSESQSNQLASLIQQAMGQKCRVHWLAHGEGAGTFVRAMQILKSSPKLHRAENDEKVRARQVVHFSNPRGKGTTTKELKELCKQLGFDLAGVQHNTYDLWNKENRASHSKMFINLGCTISVGGMVGAFGVDTWAKSLIAATQASGVYGIAFAGLTSYVLGKKVVNEVGSYARSLKGICHNTLGKGNQNWVGSV